MSLLLLNPPVAKPSEPPAGLARLAGALRLHGISQDVLDMNLGALLWLAETGTAGAQADTWTKRAFRHLGKNLEALRNRGCYQSIARYRQAVTELNRVLEVAAAASGATVGVSNYHHDRLSPLRSSDLLYAADNPGEDPFFGYFDPQLSRRIEKGDVRTVGISLNYLSQALTAFALAGYIRKRFPLTKIVMGGGLVTSWLRNPAWKDPFGGLIDHLIAGPGEGPLLSVLGICQSGERVVRPDYRLFPAEDYLSPGFILPYSASGGCYWNRCSFCPERAEGNPYVPVPAEQAATDLETLSGQTNPILIHLLDNAVSVATMKAIIQRPPGPAWYGFARFSRQLADLDFCTALRRSGCVMLKLGLESGDQRLLDRMEKGIDLGEVSVVLSNLKKAGIATYVYLLFGTPGETPEMAVKTLEFVSARAGAIGFLNLAIFNMPVYGPEADRYETRGFYEGDLSLYTDFIHPSGWGRRQVRDFLDNVFKRHRSIAPILRREPPFFTSNHAPFFVMPDSERKEKSG